MGSVLSFAPRDAATTRKPPVAGATAAIVIFPGIRYERRPDAQPAQMAVSVRRDVKKDEPKH